MAERRRQTSVMQARSDYARVMHDMLKVLDLLEPSLLNALGLLRSLCVAAARAARRGTRTVLNRPSAYGLEQSALHAHVPGHTKPSDHTTSKHVPWCGELERSFSSCPSSRN